MRVAGQTSELRYGGKCIQGLAHDDHSFWVIRLVSRKLLCSFKVKIRLECFSLIKRCRIKTGFMIASAIE